MKILVLDSSYLLYKSYFTFNDKKLHIQMDDGTTIMTGTIFGFIREIISLAKNTNYNFIIAAHDAPPYIKKMKYSFYKERPKDVAPTLQDEKEIVKSILYDLGIPQIQAKGYEGEEVALAIIDKLNKKHSIVDLYTSDEDCYAMLSENTSLIRSKYDKENRRTYFEKFTVENLQEKYGVTPKQFKSWKIFTGCTTDKVPGATGIGPKKATWLVNEFGNYKSIIRNIKTIEKADPSIARLIKTSLANGKLKASKYLIRMHKPEKLTIFKPPVHINYIDMLEFLETKTLLSGSNKIALKFIKKNQGKLLPRIKLEIWGTIP